MELLAEDANAMQASTLTVASEMPQAVVQSGKRKINVMFNVESSEN